MASWYYHRNTRQACSNTVVSLHASRLISYQIDINVAPPKVEIVTTYPAKIAMATTEHNEQRWRRLYTASPSLWMRTSKLTWSQATLLRDCSKHITLLANSETHQTRHFGRHYQQCITLTHGKDGDCNHEDTCTDHTDRSFALPPQALSLCGLKCFLSIISPSLLLFFSVLNLFYSLSTADPCVTPPV